MKALVTADWHLTDRDEDEYRWDFVENKLDLMINDLGIDTLIILGDLTDKKDKHSSKLVNRLVTALDNLSCLVNNIIILKGNHDFIDEDNPFFKFIASMNDKISYIDELHYKPEIKSMFIPYMKNICKDSELPEKVKYLFLHQDLKGAVLENGYELESTNAFDYKHIPDYTNVISGHIHVPQVIKKNVQYVGSPYPIIYGRNDIKYGVLIINEDDTIEHLELDLNIRKRTFEISSVADLKEIDFKEGDRVKIILKLQKVDVGNWQKYKKKIIKFLEKQNIDKYVLDIQVEKEKKKQKKEIKDNTIIFEPNQVFSTYCKEKKITEDIMNIGKKLLEK